jgi:hypothetical protein
MTFYANDQWDETLNAYLEGRTLRADAEDLLMRLHLDPADRDQIERSLRLTDELTLALRQIEPPHAGAESRLLAALRACPVPTDAPFGWRTIESTGEFARPIASPAPLSEDDLLDATLEGRVTMHDLQNLRANGQLTQRAAQAADDLQSAAQAITDLSPTKRPLPAATTNRLLGKLESHIMSQAGELDPKIADRLLSKTPPARPKLATPDVLAAEENPEENDE